VPTDLPRILQEAQRFSAVFPRLTPVVGEGELIVGARLRSSTQPGFDLLPDGGSWYVGLFAGNTPAGNPGLRAMAGRGLISPQGSFNHKVVDYAGYIRTGSLALIDRAKRLLGERVGPERDFTEAFIAGHEAIIRQARRYAERCEELAAAAPPERSRELREIARICGKVPACPAETFHEALQSLWFAYMVAGDGTGRIDVYLEEFYQRDLAGGRITAEAAQELVVCLLVKLHGDCMEGEINISSIQTMTLGGQRADGSDATNELTRVFLRSVRSVKLLRPSVYVRCHGNTPQDVLEQAVEMLGEGLAEPSFYGDEPIVRGLTRIGVPVEVARDYALSGCTEVTLPGRSNWGSPNGWINLALLVDEALRDCAGRPGIDREGVWEALDQHVEAVAEACRLCTIHVDERDDNPRYEASLLSPICLEKGADIAHGGAGTYVGQWEGIGLPNAADMLYAAQRIAFGEGESLDALYSRLARGDGKLFARLRQFPKFGNGVAEVDAIAARLVRTMSEALERRSTPLRSALTLGHLAGGENMHIAYGLVMGPTLDGRKAGSPLADSLAGCQGLTRAGPTAAIGSLCAIDHSRLNAGSISTVRLNKSDFATLESRRKVVSLIRTFVAAGGSQLQINLTDAETLRQARDEPSRFPGLLVRVAGYSADFTRIARNIQDEIISRTELEA
jgi:formate C-acetyltransferase